MRKLAIPPGPGALLHMALPYLDSVFERDRYVLGGGTALATRWHHRTSRDVDLFIKPEDLNGLFESRAGLLQRLQSDLTRQTAFNDWRTDASAIVLYRYEREVSLVADDKYRATEECDTRTGIVLESTQTILLKKMDKRIRSHKVVPIRDVYDILSSIVIDPQSVDGAIHEAEDGWAEMFVRNMDEVHLGGVPFFDDPRHPMENLIFPQLLKVSPGEFADCVMGDRATPFLRSARAVGRTQAAVVGRIVPRRGVRRRGPSR